MDLAAFLVARIAEDEEVARNARAWLGDPPNRWVAGNVGEECVVDEVGDQIAAAVGDAVAPHIARWDPARVVAECRAKRRIVIGSAEFQPAETGPWEDPAQGAAVRRDVLTKPSRRDVLRLLALPYADHPEYRQEWRP